MTWDRCYLRKRTTVFFWAVASALIGIAAGQSPTVESIDFGRGNVPLHIPSTYDASDPLPLIVALHGYHNAAGANYIDGYFGLSNEVEENRFLYLVPGGMVDAGGQRFWAATDGCCGSGVDDSAYLREMVETIQRDYSVDEERIHFLGHSNGGFMSHRMAIDHADMVASIISLAGANYVDAAAHDPSHPVHVLQVHGNRDNVISYNGGTAFGPYPGAEQTVLNWVEYNGILPDAQAFGDPFELDLSGRIGPETSSQVYDPDNELGVTVELWTLDRSGHSPAFGSGVDNTFAPRAVDWLLSHPKVSTAVTLSCDADGDGKCDLVDLDALYAADGTAGPALDMDGNGTINADDVDDWLLAASDSGNPAKAMPSDIFVVGDLNLSGEVDSNDLGLLLNNFGGGDAGFGGGDLNLDLAVNSSDLGLLLNNFGYASAFTSAVPEPTVTSLAVFAAIGCLGMRRRRRVAQPGCRT